MKRLIKYAAVGFAGYLIGFYEMKYKTIKVITQSLLNEKEAKEEPE